MERQSYAKLKRHENDEIPKASPQQQLSDTWSYIRTKIEALVWITIFLFVFERTKIVKELFNNPKINELFLTIFITAFGINFAIILFVSLVVPYLGYQKYEDYSPHITPFGSVVMAVGFFSLIIAIYPVYGLWSLLIVPILGMGFLMFAHFIPLHGNANSLVLFCIFTGLLVYGWCYH
jgi:hypothetical protein